VTVPDDTVIGGRLRLARAETRITQAYAAAALGIPRSAVSALEAGDRRVDITRHQPGRTGLVVLGGGYVAGLGSAAGAST
jgi:DNA-binding XRE family transcriptional regulator